MVVKLQHTFFTKKSLVMSHRICDEASPQKSFCRMAIAGLNGGAAFSGWFAGYVAE